MSGSSHLSPVSVKDADSSPIIVEIEDSPVKLVVSPVFKNVFETLSKDSESPPAKRKLFREVNKGSLHTLAYEIPPPKYSAEHILRLLLGPIDQARVCSKWPVSGIISNASFVVDVTKLRHPDDVRKDFFGKWVHSGSHPFTFKASINGSDISIEKCAPGATGNVFYLRRLHGYHPSNHEFRRMLAFVSDKCFNPHPLCLVVYYIPEGFSPTVTAHGNSKGSQPFYPTLPSTTLLIKEECPKSGPKSVVSLVESDAGGIREASYPGELPRNELQVSNFKRHVPKRQLELAGNDLYSVMLQAHLEDVGKQFIRDIKAFPDPAILLATEQQLLDLERFCCNTSSFGVLTVDPTFSLGDFDVTPTTYRHLLLRSSRTGKLTVMLGPIMIHYRKNFATYMFLAASLVSKNKHLANIQAFGTDGEVALSSALAHEFKSAIHLLCFNHVRRNLKEELRSLTVPLEVQSEILGDIFGKRIESMHLTGLVDSRSAQDFETSLANLVQKWKLHDLDDMAGPVTRFCDWFYAHKVELFKENMISSVRVKAGLGNPPEAFYTNSSECINNVIKVKVNYQKNELPNLVQKLQELVAEQQREAEKAVVGCGKYKLVAGKLEVAQSKWYSLSQERRSQCLKAFNTASVTSSFGSLSDPMQCYNIEPETIIPTQGSSQVSVQVSSLTSTSLANKVAPFTTKLGLPLQALERIAEKATELLETDGAIVSAPGYTAEAKIVKSHSGKRPHLVTPKRKGDGYVCDEECPQYKSAKLCSHTLATAVVNDSLDSFISSYTRIKRAPNLTKLATSSMPRGRGCKGTKAPSKRKPTVPVQSRFELNPATNLPSPSVQVGVSSSSNTSIAIAPPCWSDCTQFGAPPTQIFDNSNESFFPTPPSMPTWSSQCYPADPTSGGIYPFKVHFISGNISVCHGCKGRYQKLAPPYDLCLQHEEWRTFVSPGSSTSQSRFGNVYYHCNIHCVRTVWPHFLPSSVVIPSSVSLRLLAEHHSFLYTTFGIY